MKQRSLLKSQIFTAVCTHFDWLRYDAVQYKINLSTLIQKHLFILLLSVYEFYYELNELTSLVQPSFFFVENTSSTKSVNVYAS